MAERLEALEKPPVYEVSVRKILACFIGLCFYTSVLVILAIDSRSFGPLLLLLISLLFLVGYAALEYCIFVGGSDIPPKCYHPDLLPNKEYLALKRKYYDAKDGFYKIKYDGLSLTKEEETKLLKDYRKVVYSLKPILDAQNELRLLCRFKEIFGYIETPAIYKKNFDYEKEDSDIKIITDIDDPSESENENVTNDEAGIRTEVIEDEKPSDLQPPQPFEISIETSQNEPSVQNVEKTADMEKMMKQLEILEKQFAEIKAENETLKESIEQILESITVF
uniref:Uncharacterized protein n=1 Tax=Panagrolaimus sp. PS1159 TaxID=55785 RepID=A0AC35GT06_9BILA